MIRRQDRWQGDTLAAAVLKRVVGFVAARLRIIDRVHCGREASSPSTHVKLFLIGPGYGVLLRFSDWGGLGAGVT